MMEDTFGKFHRHINGVRYFIENVVFLLFPLIMHIQFIYSIECNLL
jgi:hypothetical protein